MKFDLMYGSVELLVIDDEIMLRTRHTQVALCKLDEVEFLSEAMRIVASRAKQPQNKGEMK